MTKSAAAIDLGTNTFHLLIGSAGPEGYREQLRRVDPVKLGEGGINKGIIAAPAFDRGLATLSEYADTCRKYDIEAIRAIATSAVRNAANGSEFIDRVRKETGIAITIIDGDCEAAYIYQGVRSSGCLGSEQSLIIDIGGGSVEFILCNNETVSWKQSFEIGAARLMDLFHQTDPIPDQVQGRLEAYLEEKLHPLMQAVPAVTHLVGSSGAFETFAEILHPGFDPAKSNRHVFTPGSLEALLDTLIGSSHAERASNPGIVPLRVDMVVSAAFVTRFVMRKFRIENVAMTTYSLKEGVIAEMLGL